MLYLLLEPQSADLVGVLETLHFLQEQSRARRIPMYRVQELHQIPSPNACGDITAVFLLGLSSSWIQAAAAEAYALDIFPIVLSNLRPSSLRVSCGLVAQDIDAAMRQCVSYLQSIGCRQLALYGVNPASTGDQWRTQAFLELGFPREAIFPMRETLQETYRVFAEKMTPDGVICVYDHTAVSLLRGLRAEPDDRLAHLAILSFGDAQISARLHPSLSTISHNRREVANAAFLLYELFLQCPSAASINVLLKSRLQLRQSTNLDACFLSAIPADNTYDPAEIMRVEKMLVQCDETDRRIIDCLLDGLKLSRICERCYLSETPVKRRLRLMEQHCNVSNRGELVDLLQKYFAADFPSKTSCY